MARYITASLIWTAMDPSMDDTTLISRVGDLRQELTKKGVVEYKITESLKRPVLNRRVSVHLGKQASSASLLSAAADKEKTGVAETLISMGINEESANSYAKVMAVELGVDGVDDLFYLDETVLSELKEIKFVHRRKISEWIRKESKGVV